ncbi:MAG TPA: hypothetical protein VMK42_18480 [Anaeromyxobacteraceae bacterium]|nr:hypothetical protein [Anaeromyxobacteraceae bacterium]
MTARSFPVSVPMALPITPGVPRRLAPGGVVRSARFRAHASFRDVRAFLAALALLAAAPGSAPVYRVLRSLPVGGEGGWDYVALDPEARLLYVPRSTHVAVLDLEGHVRGEVADTPGVHGVALARDENLGFASNGRGNTVTVFQLSPLRRLEDVATTGENPDAIVFDPATRRVFTLNGRGRNATALDARTRRVVGTIPLGGKPEFAVADGDGHLFANIEDTSELVRIDTRALVVEARWSLRPLQSPTGLALDRSRKRLFSVAGNRLMAVVDAESGRLLSTLAIGEHADAAAYDPGTGRAFSSNGDGTLTVVEREGADGYRVEAQLATKVGARTMALDPGTHLLYLPTARFEPAPAPTPEQPRRRPQPVAGTFEIVVVGPG